MYKVLFLNFLTFYGSFLNYFLRRDIINFVDAFLVFLVLSPRRENFYWLSAPADEVEQGKTVIATIEGNLINIERCDYSSLTIYLNDSLVNLDEKVTVVYKGKKVAKERLHRTIRNMHEALNKRNDRSYAFPAVLHVELCK